MRVRHEQQPRSRLAHEDCTHRTPHAHTQRITSPPPSASAHFARSRAVAAALSRWQLGQSCLHVAAAARRTLVASIGGSTGNTPGRAWVTTRSSTLPLQRVDSTNPCTVGTASSRSLSLTRADMAHGGPAGDFGGVGAGGGDGAGDGSGGEVGSAGQMVRSPTGDVPEAVRRVLENEALVLLGDVFRRNGHEIRLAGGVVSVASPCGAW